MLASARGTARSSVCSSNLRQVATAAFNYSIDYDGTLPPAYDGRSPRDAFWNWKLALGGYFGDELDFSGGTSNVLDIEAFYCPDADPNSASAARQIAQAAGSTNPTLRTYGMRDWVAPGLNYGSAADRQAYRSYDVIKSPSEFTWFGDSAFITSSGAVTTDYIIPAGGNANSRRWGLRHPNDMGNASFADTHTQAIDQDYVDTIDDDQPEYSYGSGAGFAFAYQAYVLPN